MFRAMVCIVFALVLIIKQPCLCLGQVSELTFADANSLKDQAMAYAESIVRGDVLVREIYLFEGLDSEIENEPCEIILETTQYYRAVFDFERDQFALYRVHDREVEEISEPSANRSPVRWVYGVVYNSELSDQVHANAIPGGASVSPRSAFSESSMAFLREIQFRDCRYAFGSLGCTPVADSFELKWKRQITGDTTTEARRVDDHHIEIVKHSPSSSLPEGWTAIYQRNRERLDIKSGFSVLSKEEGLYVNMEGVEQESSGPMVTRKVDWIGEIPVVVSGRGKGFEIVAYNGRRYRGNGMRRYDFHWILLNEKPDDALFDPSNVENVNKILTLVDPEKVGARRLARRPAANVHPADDNE